MRTHSLALAMAASALLASCAYVPINPSVERRVSPDYTASGSIEGVRAYVYANHTVIEFDRAEPVFVSVRDQAGNAVNYERVGNLFRLDRQLDAFTVWLNGTSATFAVVVVTHVFAAPPAAVASSPPTLPPVTATLGLDDQENANVVALLKLSESQLNEVRQALANASKNPKSTGEELRVLNARMDAIETQLLTVATAIVRVSFATGSTDFRPSPDVEKVLIQSAKAAQAVSVHGHTDARIAGPDDPRIALGRALAARKFLITGGIDAHKINVFSTAAGDFRAPNTLPAGRTINRRVEFKFVDSRIAQLQGHALAMASR